MFSRTIRTETDVLFPCFISLCICVALARTLVINQSSETRNRVPNIEFPRNVEVRPFFSDAFEMKDDPTAVEVRVMCGGAALVEYGRKGWTGNHSAYIESKAGESFCLDLQYHGGSLLGFYAAIGVDGVHIEGYTLVPSISESCLGKLSADGQSRRRGGFVD